MEKENIIQTEKTSSSLPNPTIWKMASLFVLTILLCLIGPFSFFAPVPLVLAFLSYGRKKFFIGTILFLLLFVLAILYNPGVLSVAIIFVCMNIYAVIISELIHKNMHPQKILFFGTSILVGLSVLAISFTLLSSNYSVDKYLSNSVTTALDIVKVNMADKLNQDNQDSRALKDFIQKPKLLVAELKHWILPFSFSILLGILWASLFLVLRNDYLWRRNIEYDYSTSNLLNYKAPAFLVYPVIFGLTLMLIGEVNGIKVSIYGDNIVYIVGIFYLFHGFGVFHDLLTHWKIFGIIRTFFTVLFILTSWKLLMLIGLFDGWINFRKFFKKNNEKE